jgi:hypothetical protein
VLLAAFIYIAPWPAGFRATGWAELGQHPDPDTLYGIGAVIVANGAYPSISEIVPGGAAAQDGHLKVNDRIAGVAQGDAAFVDCAGMTVAKVVDMVRGKKGTTVRLQVIPAGADPSKREVISLVRAEIKLRQPADFSSAAQAPPISPATQAKLDEAIKKIGDATRKLLAGNMETEIGKVVETTGLDAKGKAALENASAQAVDQCLQKSVITFGDELREQFRQVPAAQLGMVFGQIDANADTFAKAMQMQSGNWPADQPAWSAALKQTLTAQQAAVWEAAEAKRKQALEQETGDFLKNVARFATEQERHGMNEKVERIEAVLVLPKDRRDQLNAAAQSMLDQYGRDTSARAEKALLAMGDDQRKETLSQRQQGFYNWLQPADEKAWDQGLAKLLTPEEAHRLETAGDDRKTRRADAMGELLLTLLDDKIAFTAAQRQQLEPILQGVAKAVPELTQDQDPDSYFSYSLSTFYGAIAAAPDDRIKAILDPVQWRHWEGLSKLKEVPDPNIYVQVALQLPATEDATKPGPPPEPEDVERAVSDFLVAKSRAERETVLGEAILKAEDIARVVHLTGDAAERLQTAARGSADAFMTGWNGNAEMMVRSVIGDASPETIKQRLDSIPSYQFQQQMFSFESGPRQHSVWDDTVKAVLTPDQEKAWKQETDARGAYRQKAIAALVVAAFDQSTGLTPDQWAKLEPLVVKFLADYSDEIGNYFRFSQAWFLQSYSVFIPIAGIPEKDLKSILTTDQWDHWNGSNECSSANEYWSNLDQNRRQRVKAR